MAEVRELSFEECAALLRGGVAGRVGVCTPLGPHIIPVNYTVDGASIVFRTTPYSVLGTYARQSQLAFEVDLLDHAHQTGWSVVVRGRGHQVTDNEELRRLRETCSAALWADGHRNLFLRLPWTEVSGRRIGREPAPVTGGTLGS